METNSLLIGSRIKDSRKCKGLTQYQLAELIYISESYINLIESNKRNPSMDVLTKIADTLDISMDYLVFGSAVKSEKSLYNEWKKLVEGRNNLEIESIVNLTRTFLESLDKINDAFN